MRNILHYFIGKFRTTKNTEVIAFDKDGFIGPLGLNKKLDKNQSLTASEEIHLFEYLNPYYCAAYSLPKRRK